MKIKNINIRIFQEIGTNIAVSLKDGDKIYQKINTVFEKNIQVNLDFINIKIITSAFLNAAIGQLYNKYNSDKLKNSLKLINMTPEDKELLKRVVDRAQEYYKDKDSINKIIEKSINND